MASIAKKHPEIVTFRGAYDFYLHIIDNDKHLLYFSLYLWEKTMVSIENVNKNQFLFT